MTCRTGELCLGVHASQCGTTAARLQERKGWVFLFFQWTVKAAQKVVGKQASYNQRHLHQQIQKEGSSASLGSKPTVRTPCSNPLPSGRQLQSFQSRTAAFFLQALISTGSYQTRIHQCSLLLVAVLFFLISFQKPGLLQRVCRVALPLWLLFLAFLLLAFLLPLMDEGNSCSISNNFARSFSVMLRYSGPPPT